MSGGIDGPRGVAANRAPEKTRMRAGLLVVAVLAVALALPASAFATSAETWVSATGKDTGTCTVTAPCASFQYAISQTAPNGEIDVLTSGSYGALTIEEPVTIFANGVTAAIQFTGGEGIYVNLTSATPGHVVLHGLDIDGDGGVGTDAIFDASSSPELTENEGVEIEDCDIYGFSQIGVGVGDEGTTEAANSVTISHSTIDGGTLGVRTFQSSSRSGFPGQVVLDNDVIEGASSAGVFTRQSESKLVAENDLIEDNTIGFEADTGPGNYTLDNDEIDDNTEQGVMVFAPQSGSSQLVLDGDQINDNGNNGVMLAGGGFPVDALLDGDDIDDNIGDGLDATAGPVSVSNSSLSGNTATGVDASGTLTAVSLANDTITQNATGLEATGSGSIVFYGAANSVFGNTTDGSPSSTVSDGAFGPIGPAGADGTNGATGAAGPAGTNGPQGPAGTNGTNGEIGATGPAGTNGPPGPAGEIELVTCTSAKKKVKKSKKTVTQKQCTTKLASSPVSFTASAASATLARAGHVDATGSLHGDKLTLRSSQTLRAGRYTLKLTTGTGRDEHTSSEAIAIS